MIRRKQCSVTEEQVNSQQRKAQRQAEAKERQARFDELTNTSIKIQEYIESRLNTDEQVGAKVEKKLVARGMKMINKKYGIKRKK